MNFITFGFRGFLEADEYIQKAFRRPFVHAFFRLAVWGFIFIGIGSFLIWFFQMGVIWGTGLGGLLVLFGVYKVLGNFFVWYYEAILMTNEAIVFTKWPNLFHRWSSRIEYNNLDQIDVERKGLNAFLLNYGNLYFSKVHGGDTYIAYGISAPRRVARIIENYREEQVYTYNFSQESSLKELMTGMLSRHHRGDEGVPPPNAPVSPLTQMVAAAQTPTIPVESAPEPPKPQKEVYLGEDIYIEKKLDNTGGIDLDI